jgi:glutathione synthase/RimK-type ligase-like ATP-grasp enzyme
MPSTVLIVTNDHDTHADSVIRELHRRGVPVFRFHPVDLPHACSVSIEIQRGRIEGEISNAYHRVALSDICGAWFRRARNSYSDPINPTSEKLADYVKAQNTATLDALFHSLRTLWVGHPYLLRRAEIKALQLAEASKAGLTTPNTLISNDPARARVFVDELGDKRCAIKPQMALGVTDKRGYHLPLTAILPPGYSLEAVAALAHTTFQPYIEKAAELRCVVIGERIFTARINSQANEDTRIDWRAAGSREEEIFSLPDQVKASIHRLMDSFGINFASIDLIVTPDNEFVFLELNPNGQWLWLELGLGLPLTAAMADLLTTNYAHPARRTEGAAAADAARRDSQAGAANVS